MLNKVSITPQTVKVCYPDGSFLGNFNEYEFTLLRGRVKDLNVSGYYALYNGKRIYINADGSLSKYCLGFFTLLDELKNDLLII